MSRIIGIRHRIKRTAKGEARPTQVTILEEGKEPVVHKLADETAELDFLVGLLPTKWKILAEGETPEPGLPVHHIMPFGERFKVPASYDGLKDKDRIAMSLGGSGDYFAFSLSLRGEQIGAKVFRIPPYKLKEYRQENSKDDDSLFLAQLLDIDPSSFLATAQKDRKLILLKQSYDGLEQAKKARIACEQRLRQLVIGRVFCTPDLYHVGALEKEFERAKASDELLKLLQKDERARAKEVEEALESFPIYTSVLANVKGFGPKMAARIIAGAGDVRKFATIAKWKAYCGVHLVPSPIGVDESGDSETSFVMPKFIYPRRRVGAKSNWNDQCRQGFYLFATYCVKSKNSEWGQKFLAYKEHFQLTHPEVVVAGKRKLYTKGHIHQMALARTMTKFAEYMYRQWSRLETEAAVNV